LNRAQFSAMVPLNRSAAADWKKDFTLLVESRCRIS
jgi:hypothetical protein